MIWLTSWCMNIQSDTIGGWRARIYNRLMDMFGSRGLHEKVLSSLILTEKGRLLDVGCGTGTFLQLAHAKFPRAELVGVDASEDMLAEARKVKGNAFQLEYADAAHLPFGAHSFDAAVSILTFHHMPRGVKIRAIQELSRVLKPGGTLVIADLARPEGRWGRVVSWYLNFHSFTRGNWPIIEAELERWHFSLQKEETVRGFVGLAVATRREGSNAPTPAKQ